MTCSFTSHQRDTFPLLFKDDHLGYYLWVKESTGRVTLKTNNVSLSTQKTKRDYLYDDDDFDDGSPTQGSATKRAYESSGKKTALARCFRDDVRGVVSSLR